MASFIWVVWSMISFHISVHKVTERWMTSFISSDSFICIYIFLMINLAMFLLVFTWINFMVLKLCIVLPNTTYISGDASSPQDLCKVWSSEQSGLLGCVDFVARRSKWCHLWLWWIHWRPQCANFHYRWRDSWHFQCQKLSSHGSETEAFHHSSLQRE